jgi:carbon-monoxide dehydrogenase medium subunit
MTYTYRQPRTLEEALELTASKQATLIAGGTDLLVGMKKQQRAPRRLVSLRRVDELGRIEETDGLRIGAAVPLSEIERHPTVVSRHPALVDSIAVLGSRQIRNVATLGGNLCNASPAADTAPPLLAYGARVELRNADRSRQIALEDFFRGPGQTVLEPGEILTAILLDVPSPDARSVFLRKGRVRMDVAIASVAALLEMDGSTCVRARLAAGAVAPVPLRLRRTEALVEGSVPDESLRVLAVEEARREISPITDVRTTAGYRRHLVGVFVERALARLPSAATAGAGVGP